MAQGCLANALSPVRLGAFPIAHLGAESRLFPGQPPRAGLAFPGGPSPFSTRQVRLTAAQACSAHDSSTAGHHPSRPLRAGETSWVGPAGKAVGLPTFPTSSDLSHVALAIPTGTMINLTFQSIKIHLIYHVPQDHEKDFLVNQASNSGQRLPLGYWQLTLVNSSLYVWHRSEHSKTFAFPLVPRRKITQSKTVYLVVQMQQRRGS